jgi:hypothetical protein
MRTALVLLSFVTFACRSDGLPPTGPRVVVTPQGLEQTVRLSPEIPASGDTLDISSVIVNATTSPVDVTSRTCGFDIESSLALVNSYLHCAAYSMHGELAAGDSIVGLERRFVAGKAGTYTLRVRHLLDPDVWVEIPITVR